MLAAAALMASACESGTGVDGDVADVRGTWAYTGDQSAPSLALAGELVIESQAGDLLTGSLSWEERDGQGGVTTHAGAVSGRVIGHDDVDFDVFASNGVRRHVARLVDGSMDGAWVQVSTGRSGRFEAARELP